MVVVACALLVAGCGGSKHGNALTGAPEASGTATAAASPTATGTPRPKPAPRKVGPPPVPASFRRAAQRLPLAQRAAQLLVVGFEGIDLSAPVFGELADHGWGGIVVGPANVFDESGVGVFAGEARVRAEDAGRVPPLVAAFDDGRPDRLGSNRREARAQAQTAAAAAGAQGITLTTAPFIDVGLGADADLIARLAPAAVTAWRRGGVAPAPGHFPGEGVVTQDPLDGPANVGSTAGDLAGRDLKPFLSALKKAPAVTVSSATFTAYDPVTPAALTPTVVQDLLRGGLRFGGVAMTDDLRTLAVQTGRSQARAGVAALRAGIDLLYVPEADQRAPVYAAVLRAAKRGKIPRARLLEAASRVLELKARVGLRAPSRG
jgi:beta-N-acetylhexosaminidase